MAPRADAFRGPRDSHAVPLIVILLGLIGVLAPGCTFRDAAPRPASERAEERPWTPAWLQAEFVVSGIT